MFVLEVLPIDVSRKDRKAHLVMKPSLICAELQYYVHKAW